MKSRSSTAAIAVLALVVLAFACERAAAQVPYLLRDINARPPGSSPWGFVDMGGIGYFQAFGPRTGAELWRSDGTASGTWLVADIDPGEMSSSPGPFSVIGGRLYFVATQQATGLELWTSDGTTAGTRLVKELAPGSSGMNWISSLVESGGIVYFSANLSDGTAALYRSDGTDAGTYPIQELCLSCWEAVPLALVGGRLVFRGFDAAHGWELWSSDGTAAGTALLADIFPGVGSGFLESGNIFTLRGGTAMFLADDGVSGLELWQTDGTAGGTRLVADIAPGPISPFINWATPQVVLGNDMLFQVDDGGLTCTLWKSDGTTPGTSPVTTLASGLGCGSVVPWIASGGLAYFPVLDGLGDAWLWRSDGTATGTWSLGVLFPLFQASEQAFATLAGTVYFSGLDVATGQDLWATDGSVAGTARRFDFPPGGDGSVLGLAQVGGKLLLSATDAASGVELWQSDGSAAGTTVVTRMNAGATQSSSAIWPSAVSGGLCLGGWGEQNTWELWCTDGTVPGTRRVDLPCDPAVGCISEMESAGDWLMVQIDDGLGHGFEPWRVEPMGAAPPPPVPLGDLCLGPCASEPRLLTRGGPLALMSVHSDEAQFLPSLWRTDGTLPGTRQVSAASPDWSGPGARQSADLGGIVYFAAYQQDSGVELWRSDGTGPGTFEVKDIYAGPDSSNPADFVVLGNRVYFAADDGDHGRELWSTGGTGPDTRLALDLCPGICDGAPTGLMRNGDSLFFIGQDSIGSRLYRSDGTAPGTIALATVDPVGTGWVPPRPIATSGLVFFLVWDAAGSQVVLWSTDGTIAGTGAVPGLPRVTSLLDYSEITALAGQVWLYATEAAHGAELWHTDGLTSAMVADLSPGPGDSMPWGVNPWIRAVDRYLVFVASDGLTGEEPWALELPAGQALLRNDSIRSLAPVVPAMASLLPLDPARDRYREHVVTGEVDPEDRVLRDAVRPLVFYGLDGAGTIRLAKTALGQVRIAF